MKQAGVLGTSALSRYPELRGLHSCVNAYVSAASTSGLSDAGDDVIDYLAKVWGARYSASSPGADIVEVGLAHSVFREERGRQRFYLFDVARSRLIAAWGVSYGQDGTQSSDSRRKGHPGAGKRYHRGHALKRLMGAGEDINLVPQLGLVNNGRFKTLENLAVANPGSLYFTFWSYNPAAPANVSATQRPTAVEQGLLRPGFDPVVLEFSN